MMLLLASHLLLFIILTFFCRSYFTLAFQCSTSTFTNLIPAGASVNFVYRIEQNGTFGQGKVDAEFPGHATNLPPLCVVSINVQSSPISSFNFGMFLPDNWSSRFIVSGNSGFGGGIDWVAMGRLLQYTQAGFATLSTDTGHLSWALNNPEAIVDWSYRALHESIVLGKRIIVGVYGDNLQYSYFTGCSNGGRQGLKTVQMYPTDFDGVLVGAPPWELTRLHPWVIQVGLYNLPTTSNTHIYSHQFIAILGEMLRQCDPQDGVTDGIIMEPYGCNFDTTALACSNSSVDRSACLTDVQINTLSNIYNDWISQNDTLLFPTFPLGANPTRYAIPGIAPSRFGLEYVDNFVYNNSAWDWHDFSKAMVVLADQLDTGNANADDFDLSPFKATGGKLIHYHGFADPTIPIASSILYYEQVLKTMSASNQILDDFYRLFTIPGMGHCSGSQVAPYYIAAWGQVVHGALHSVPGYEDPEHDVVLAMMRWVEDGAAPGQIIATKFADDSVSRGVSMQRPLCVYPAIAKYNGIGNVSVASSWSCEPGGLLDLPTKRGSVGTVKFVKRGTVENAAVMVVGELRYMTKAFFIGFVASGQWIRLVGVLARRARLI